MELFASTDTEVDINGMQEQLKENSYPHYYKIVHLTLTVLWVPRPLREAFQQCVEYGIGCDPPWDRSDFLLWLSSILTVICPVL